MTYLSDYRTARQSRLERLGFGLPAKIINKPVRQRPSSGDAAVPMPQRTSSPGTAAPKERDWLRIASIQYVGAAPFLRSETRRIQETICQRYGISLANLIGPFRTQRFVRPRHIAMYLVATLTDKSLPEIGRRFGGRDHTVALYARKKIAALRLADPEFDDELIALETALRGAS